MSFFLRSIDGFKWPITMGAFLGATVLYNLKLLAAVDFVSNVLFAMSLCFIVITTASFSAIMLYKFTHRKAIKNEQPPHIQK